MTRMRIALAIAASFVATTAHAQNTHFTVGAAPASVYKAPTNVSPVIGEAKQGATLEVTRDVGSWVKVAWSTSPDGVGYIRKSAGTLGGATASAAVAAPPPAAATPAAAPRPAATASVSAAPAASAAAAPRATAVQGVPVVRPQS